jgi:hypothetical protein
MANGKIQSITYTWDRIIVGFLNSTFNGLFTTALAAGGAGIQVEGAGSELLQSRARAAPMQRPPRRWLCRLQERMTGPPQQLSQT